MVVVDKLTKAKHFIPIKVTHNVPKEIVSNKYPKFTSNFWKGLFRGFGTNLNLCTTYHPYLYGKIERINRIIEYMLRMYVMDKPSRWEDYIHLVDVGEGIFGS
jgi:hypothetical protein